MRASEVYAEMAGTCQRLSDLMQSSRREVLAMRRRLLVLAWLDRNDPDSPRWWQS